MDGARFDELARGLAAAVPWRALVADLVSLAATGLGRSAAAAYPEGQVLRPGDGCICKRTGRPPVDGSYCPPGQRSCGSSCVPLDGCCSVDECSAGPPNSVTICRRGACLTECDSKNGATDCGAGCCAADTVCVDEDRVTCCESGVACEGVCCPTDRDVCLNGECCTPPLLEDACNGGAGDLGKICGEIMTTCGTVIDCGGWVEPETCGGGGPHQHCGCTPLSCADQHVYCGETMDGCGVPLDCGGCPEGSTCGADLEGYCGVGCECTGDQICRLKLSGSPGEQRGCCLPPGALIPGGCEGESAREWCCAFPKPGDVMAAACDPSTGRCVYPPDV